MKTQFKKIFVTAIALLFVGFSISFAQDWKDVKHKPPGNAYGYYKKDVGNHPGLNNKRHEPKGGYREKYVHREVHEYDHHYDQHPSYIGTFFSLSIFDPNVAFSIVLQELR